MSPRHQPLKQRASQAYVLPVVGHDDGRLGPVAARLATHVARDPDQLVRARIESDDPFVVRMVDVGQVLE
jgi:hypothetical protein